MSRLGELLCRRATGLIVSRSALSKFWSQPLEVLERALEALERALEALELREGGTSAPSAPERLEPDPLELVTREHPAEVAKFMHAVTVLAVLSGAGCALASAAILPSRWDLCWRCSRPLHVWALGHSALQLLQAPVRLAMSFGLLRARRRGGDTEAFVRIFTRSPPWQLSKGVAMATYGWFMVGAVWLVNSNLCRPCPGLFALCLAMMVAAVARVFLCMAAWKYLLPQAAVQPLAPQAAPRPRGARSSAIQALPCVPYSPETFGPEGETACAVCLCDFERGETLRQLPCGHKYHRVCVDRWLSKSGKCPLCVHDVEVPLPESMRRRLARTLDERGA